MSNVNFDWRELLNPIAAGRMIPIVGPELLTYCDKDGKTVPLRGVMARMLAERCGLDATEFSERSTLCDVIYRLPSEVRKDETIYDKVRLVYEDLAPPVSPSLRQIAKVGFQAYLTTTWEPLLCQAIAEERYGGDISRVFVCRCRMADNGGKGLVIDIPWATVPAGMTLVYHLLGGLDSSGSDYALTEEDMLRCAARYIEGRQGQLANFVSFLERVKLLTLGCSFPNWFARFFLCILKGDRIEQTVRLADEGTRTDPDLCAFMARGGNCVYDSDALDFTERLHEQWLKRCGDRTPVDEGPTAIPFRPGAIFISYSKQSEADSAAATALYEALKRIGANVWMDVRLEGGDDYQDEILRHIDTCSIFVPILSRHAAARQSGCFLRWEWDEALATEERKRRSNALPKLVFPVRADDVGYAEDGLPSAFRERKHWLDMPDGVPTSIVVEKLVRYAKTNKEIMRRSMEGWQ